MADKTTGELRSVNIGDLPGSADIYDDFKMPGELQGEAVHVTGAQFKQYAVQAVKPIVKDLDEKVASATNAGAAAQSALVGVREALNNLPEGSTIIVNDLTTGGTSAALSAEMGKVLGRRPNPNLLHNWYFANPVNQRGQTEYVGTGYTVDRWKLALGGADQTLTVDIENGFLNYNSGKAESYKSFRQPMDSTNFKSGVTYTMSILCDVKEVSGNPGIRFCDKNGTSTGNSAPITKTGKQLISLTFTPNDSQAPAGVDILVAKSVNAYINVDIYAVKVELGDTQTLAHQDADGNWVLNEIPDYGEELAKCQRYQQVVENAIGGATIAAWGMVMTTTAVGFVIPLASTMRINAPAVTFSNVEWCLGSSYSDIPTNATLSAIRIAGNVLQVLVTFPAAHGFEVGSIVGLRLTKSKNARVLLDANL